ncbi:MAG: hypothetical protein ABSH01_01505 [Terriglobia bacterium]
MNIANGVLKGRCAFRQAFEKNRHLVVRLKDDSVLAEKPDIHLKAPEFLKTLSDSTRLGSVCRIHTCSYRSIRQIHSALQEIQTFAGGRLAGITAKLTVRPEEATYFDRKEKRKKTSSI